jgi:hypothetical protein
MMKSLSRSKTAIAAVAGRFPPYSGLDFIPLQLTECASGETNEAYTIAGFENILDPRK